jgi:hypothetical protein
MKASVIGLVLVAIAVAPGYGQGATPITVSGEVIDLACYARNKDTGRHHGDARECAWACVKWEGQPVGLLLRDGRSYQLAGGLVANNNEKIARYVGTTVSVTGTVTVVDGMPMLSSDDVRVVTSEAR